MGPVLRRRTALTALTALPAVTLAVGTACSIGLRSNAGGAAPGASGAPGASAAAGLSGTLAFGSDGNISTLDLATRTRKQLTQVPSGGFARDPVWGKGGAELIYAYSPPLAVARGPGGMLPLPVTDLYTMPAAGGEGKPLIEHDAPGSGYESPVLTPDGKSLLVTYTALIAQDNIVRDQVTEVARVTPGGGRQTLVSSAMFPAISADGQRLAFVATSHGGQGIGLADLDGRNSRLLLPPGQLDGLAALRFSPDGKQIIFSAFVPVAPAATVTPLQGRASLLSPPRALAHGLPMDIFSVPVDGSAARRLTQLGEDSPAVTWSPDGRRLAILAGGGIYVMFPDGSGFASVDPKGGHGTADWKK